MKERIRSNFYPERKFYQSDSFEIILEILMTWYLSKGSRTHLAWLFLRAWDSKESAMSHVSEPLSDPFLCHGFFWQFACNAGSLTRQHTNLPTNCISLSCEKKKLNIYFCTCELLQICFHECVMFCRWSMKLWKLHSYIYKMFFASLLLQFDINVFPSPPVNMPQKGGVYMSINVDYIW